jgi:Ca2+-binding RTX toxin-like protein
MAVIKGTTKAETLKGTAQADQMTGLGGADILRGLGGNDILDGGTGSDTFYGSTGDDTYIVDSVSDRIVELAGEGTDLVKAGVSFSLGRYVENLLLTGSAAINGTGNSLANTLTGNGGSNTLSGLGGNDSLSGGAGMDRLVGGTGMDTMTGGAGTDRFVFDDGDFASRTSTGADVIVDFTAGEKIDLALVDAVSSSTPYNEPGDQAFVFIGHNRFHIETGQELRYDVSGGNTYVYGNVNGDATADFCIKILGVHNLTSSDFVL